MHSEEEPIVPTPVNEELSHRMAQLSISNDDLQNLLTNLSMAVVEFVRAPDLVGATAPAAAAGPIETAPGAPA